MSSNKPATSRIRPYDPFKNRHKFQDDVWAQIRLNDLERDVVDTPEFQRLFRTSQMGFVELVYHTANHTRGAHSIGACRITNRLIDRLVENTADLHERHAREKPGLYADFAISPAERILIRLGALLHDVSHVPLSHDLEKKTHKIFYPHDKVLKLRSWYGHYDKHDDYEQNPILFKLVCDKSESILARVLGHYSGPFWELLQRDANDPAHYHLTPFVDVVSKANSPAWSPDEDLLGELLFHLLIYETPKEAEHATRSLITGFDSVNALRTWHLGPKSLPVEETAQWHQLWYQPFRHDIIGNTLSADLIDYLTRDPQRLGTQRRIDLHLLSYYALVNLAPDSPLKQYRCAIDLQDHKRGTTRTFLINDLFRLLDLRQDIHEKAVMHRVVQSANAMLARGLLLLGRDDMPGDDKRPTLEQVVGLTDKQQHALQSEDVLFTELLTICDNTARGSERTKRHLNEARRIFRKLTERRIYRPLVIIPGDWAEDKLSLPRPSGTDPDFPLRTLATIVDSPYYSPFLLFVCSCIEKYLQGVFDTDTDVRSYVEQLAADDVPPAVLEEARTVVPSRVIAWTMPYKQLYKDPAVVVALNGCVDQVDKLDISHAIDEKSTRERIETAIKGADSKYAALWQLYVFISDGLYYSGILNKLLRSLPDPTDSESRRDAHEVRLRNSQALLSLAFKAICINWSGLNSKYQDVEEKRRLLENRMDGGAFRDVIVVWVANYRSRTSWPGKWSTVDVRQYYHEFFLDKHIDDALKRPCRDSRYKFDVDASKAWALARHSADSPGFPLTEFLISCGFDDPTLFADGEFRELVELFAQPETRERCMALADKREDPMSVRKALKALWLTGFPWLEEMPKAKDFPSSPQEIQEWLEKECEILRPNVRRNLAEDLEPVVEVLHRAAAKYDGAVFRDFQTRLQKEATLIGNDVRTGRLVAALKRRWERHA